jgi:putative ABC transport system permease protein
LSWQKDEIDAVYVNLAPDANVAGTGSVLRGLLETSHRGASDFTVIVPAELLAEQQRTKQLFAVVMVAIASISLLVGGIGIMNIMLASVMERTREIGLRRAVGATRPAIVRQFLVETTLITVTGGFLGTLVGIVLSQLVAYFAGWSTIVSAASVGIASVVSVSIGIVFGLYPAIRAAELDPVRALHYE